MLPFLMTIYHLFVKIYLERINEVINMLKERINEVINMLKERSKLLLTITTLEIILSIWALLYFNYLDRLNYQESIVNNTKDLALLIQNMFTSTWWALIILVLALIAIFSLVALIYKDLRFQFISVMLWFILLIIALNFKDNFLNNISTIAIFIPIIISNIFAYYNQKKLLIK